MDRRTISHGLHCTLERTDYPTLGAQYVGKVRDNYTRDGRRYIITTDRISAFDRVLGTLPFKGQLLTQMAAFWFEKTKHLVPNHVISVPDPNVMECEECDPLPVEMVVRAYVTGVTSTSIWTHYAAGKRVFCGHSLPDGLRKNQKLPAPILTPSTKAAGDSPGAAHDISASREEILALTNMSPNDFDRAGEMAMKLFQFGQAHAASRGLILVDTKYEFGKRKNGDVILMDEIHTPDSSRYWFADSYEERFLAQKEPESFDKEFVRRYLAGIGYTGDGPAPTLPDDIRVDASLRYIEAYEKITGREFTPNSEPPNARIAKALGVPSP